MDPITIQQVATDFSVWALFTRADIVVKLVMLGLFAASVWSWAVIFEKLFLFRRIEALADRFEDLFWSGKPLIDIYQATASGIAHPIATLFNVVMREASNNKSGTSKEGFMERRLQMCITEEMTQLEKRMVFLATTGAVAPFVGLFGTVWGIMNSFQAIAATRDTDLAVVAPGIAEALFATGLGLLAAIPAVVAYNVLTGRLNKYAARLDGFAEDFLLTISDDKK